MKKFLSSGLIIAAMISLVGCGGSSDSSSTFGISKYIDSAVAGVNYTCGTKEGITKADGEFTFEIGSGCTFHLGVIKLREVAVAELVDGANLYEKNSAIASVLQGLDTDNDLSNGITINPDIVAAMVEANITEIPDTDGVDLEVVKTEIENNGGTYVTVEDAQAHLDETATTALTSLLAGKTFYNVGSDNTGDNWIDKIVFNADATSVAATSLVDSTDSATFDTVIEVDKIALSNADEAFALTFIEQAADKLVFVIRDVNGTTVEEDFMFFNQTDAQAYYDSLQPEPVTDPATLETFVSGKSFDVGDGMIMNFGSDYSYSDNDQCTGTWSAVTGNSLTVTGGCSFDVTFNGELVDGVAVIINVTDVSPAETFDTTFTEVTETAVTDTTTSTTTTEPAPTIEDSMFFGKHIEFTGYAGKFDFTSTPEAVGYLGTYYKEDNTAVPMMWNINQANELRIAVLNANVFWEDIVIFNFPEGLSTGAVVEFTNVVDNSEATITISAFN